MNKTTQTPEEENPFFKHPVVQRITKTLQLLKYFIISCVILTLMEIGYAYWLVSSRWTLFLTKEQMTAYADSVTMAKPLPANFMKVYQSIFPNNYTATLRKQIFINYGSRILLRHTELEQKPHCFCDFVYDIMVTRDKYLYNLEWDGRLQDLEFGFGIEKYTTPEKCFEYTWAYWVPKIQSELDPAKFPYLMNKTIAELSDDEIIEVILISQDRERLNRYKNPENFQRKFEMYKAKYTASLTKGK
jgi:hypothetical protein